MSEIGKRALLIVALALGEGCDVDAEAAGEADGDLDDSASQDEQVEPRRGGTLGSGTKLSVSQLERESGIRAYGQIQLQSKASNLCWDTQPRDDFFPVYSSKANSCNSADAGQVYEVLKMPDGHLNICRADSMYFGIADDYDCQEYSDEELIDFLFGIPVTFSYENCSGAKVEVVGGYCMTLNGDEMEFWDKEIAERRPGGTWKALSGSVKVLDQHPADGSYRFTSRSRTTSAMEVTGSNLNKPRLRAIDPNKKDAQFWRVINQ